MTTIRVTRDLQGAGTIHPMQCGQFVEHLCNLIPAMWADKLRDNSFEGLTPYRFAFIAQTDFKENPWYPSGAVNRAKYVSDSETKVSGKVSQRIHVGGTAPCKVGVSQDGIAVRQGEACAFRIYLKAEGLRGSVHVRLHQDGATLASCAFAPTSEWVAYTASFTAAATATRATLSIHFDAPGTLWLDNASLIPMDSVGGWRRDVVEAVRAMKPGVIRYGGSALDEDGFGDFEWTHTIGDADKRTPFHAWGGLQPQGAGLEEIVQFCHAVWAEPLICVRFTGRTPESAAQQVEYFNGATSTEMGSWRAKNGCPEPYNVRYWQVGNERSSPEYEERLADFCKAMKAVDPTIILLSSYPTPAVLKNAAQYLDYVCPHQYDCADLTHEREQLDRVREMLKTYAPDRNIKIGVTEWNTTAGNWGTERAMLWTLENALKCSRYHHLMHQNCDLVEIANRSNLTNSFCSGVLQTDNHRLYKTPTYYAQQLYALHCGEHPLRFEAESPLDISATLNQKEGVVSLFVVNDTLREVAASLNLAAFGNRGREIEAWTLADREREGSPDVTNSFDDPERIATVSSSFEANGELFSHTFPALSLTVLRWKV